MIPVNEPLIGKEEIKYATECLRTGWISSEGHFIKKFELKFADYVKRNHAICVNNGTNALILALRTLNFEPGSEIIIPSFTIISCALACIYNNLIPIFVDADPVTWCIDPEKIEEKISPKTRAIMAVHIYGYPCAMEILEKISKTYNLAIIEDFAEAIGSEYQGRKCGSFGVISCASFYANKVITTGEGGICVTDDPDMAEKMSSLRNLAFIPQKRFIHEELGFNFRMTNIQAAIGLAQLEQIEKRINKKIRIAHFYNKELKSLEKAGLVKLPPHKTEVKSTYWMYGILLSEKMKPSAQEVMAKLADNNIQTRPFFYPLHSQPAFQKFPWNKKESQPISEYLYKKGFYIPSGLAITDDQLRKVCAGVNKVINGF